MESSALEHAPRIVMVVLYCEQLCEYLDFYISKTSIIMVCMMLNTFNIINLHPGFLTNSNNMSNTRKEQQRKVEEEANTSTTIPTQSSSSTTTSTSTAFDVSQVQRDQQHSVNRALDETKNNIRRATDEARKDIPRYTQAANEYQEQTIQTAREIADNFLESQKEIINSVQSSWVPAVENAYSVFWNHWISSRLTTDIYARTVSNIADNTIATTRLVNNTVFSNLDAFKTCVQNTRDNAKEFSRIGDVRR
jgi:vacuolar-type H+-ATPase subunit H